MPLSGCGLQVEEAWLILQAMIAVSQCLAGANVVVKALSREYDTRLRLSDRSTDRPLTISGSLRPPTAKLGSKYICRLSKEFQHYHSSSIVNRYPGMLEKNEKLVDDSLGSEEQILSSTASSCSTSLFAQASAPHPEQTDATRNAGSQALTVDAGVVPGLSSSSHSGSAGEADEFPDFPSVTEKIRTAEEERLLTLNSRILTHQKTLQCLSSQRLGLLYDLQSTQSHHQRSHTSHHEPQPYIPSIAAHSAPSSVPTLASSETESLMAEAKAALKEHIAHLHRYNEIKDVAQGLIGLIADARGDRVRDCQGEFGVGNDD